MFPDLHPFLVHFPLAWLPLAAFWTLRDAWRMRDRPEGTAATREGSKAGGLAGPDLGGAASSSFGTAEVLLLLAFGFAVAASATGDAALSAYALSGRALEVAEEHRAVGSWVPWLTGLALVLRVALMLRLRRGGPGPNRTPFLRWAAALVVVLAMGLALSAGYHGGRLVHEEGISRATAPLAEPAETDTPDVYRAR